MNADDQKVLRDAARMLLGITTRRRRVGEESAPEYVVAEKLEQMANRPDGLIEPALRALRTSAALFAASTDAHDWDDLLTDAQAVVEAAEEEGIIARERGNISAG